MRLQELINQLHFDEVIYVKNPYFYIRDYEDKGVIVLIKKEKNSDLQFRDLENICFECPEIENHSELIRMVLFNVSKEDKIVSYSIASSKYKILRSDILKYEKFINIELEIEVE